jgi:GTP diphosphokinase / guanosine-3',5'-bis(diphosphate) 3'-diphosphatase
LKEWIAVLKAADAAARRHAHQSRKGAAEEPYINHLLEVASLVAQATNGNEPDLVVVALLHDAIEDARSPSPYQRTFRGRVADIIEELMEDKSLAKAERKNKQITSAARKTDSAKIDDLR